MKNFEVYLETRDRRRILLDRTKSISEAENYAHHLTEHLERRFQVWEAGGFQPLAGDDLLNDYEGCNICIEDVRTGKVWVV